MAKVTVRTIRCYDSHDVLKPSFVSESGTRFYTDEDFARLQQILLLKFLGFSLNDIKNMTIGDTDYHFTALYRMDQQQEYITQYFQAVKAASKTDSQIVVHLFDMIQDYMVTDMTKDQYVKIAMDGMEAGSLTSEDFYTVPGVEETTEKYDVYRADRQAAIQIILDLFYRETE